MQTKRHTDYNNRYAFNSRLYQPLYKSSLTIRRNVAAFPCRGSHRLSLLTVPLATSHEAHCQADRGINLSAIELRNICTIKTVFNTIEYLFTEKVSQARPPPSHLYQSTICRLQRRIELGNIISISSEKVCSSSVFSALCAAIQLLASVLGELLYTAAVLSCNSSRLFLI